MLAPVPVVPISTPALKRPAAPASQGPAIGSLPTDRYVRAGKAPLPSLSTTQGNMTRLLVGQEQVVPEAVSMIQNAQHLIQLDVFLLGGTSGNAVADAIIQKMKDSKGAVEVQINVDPGMGTLGSVKNDMLAVVAKLQAAGATVLPYNMKSLPSNGNPVQNISQVDHAKLLDIDSQSLLFGSMNLCTPGQINRDLMVRIDGPAAAQEYQVMNRDFTLSGGAPAPLLPVPPASGNDAVSLIMTSGDRQDTKSKLIQEINDANTCIDVGMYQFDDPEVADALIAAKQRGVSVQVLLSKDDKYTKYAPVIGGVIKGMPNQAMEATLLNAGIQVKWYAPANPDEELHAKYAVIDGQEAVVGSTNFTEKSFTIYRDSEAFIQSADLAKDLDTRMFEDDWQNHSQVAKKPGIIGKAQDGLINLLRDTKLAEW